MLNIESKELLEMCQKAGYDVKNQLSSLDPEQREAVEAMVKRGGGGTATLAPPRPVGPPTAAPKERVRVLDSRPKPPPQGRPIPQPEQPPAPVAPAAPPEPVAA